TRAVNFREDGNGSRPPFNRRQFVLDAGTDPSVAIQVQLATGIELELSPVMSQVVGIDSVEYLSGDVGRAVVAAANIHHAAVARGTSSLGIEVDFGPTIGTRADSLCLRIPRPDVGPHPRLPTYPGGMVESDGEEVEVAAIT